MKVAGFYDESISNGLGWRAVLFVSGCPHHCPGCQNSETWDFQGGKEIPADMRGQIIKAICANNIIRNFSVLGG